MIHYTREEWNRYITGNLPEALRDEYGVHLAKCMDCLQVYMECVEQLADRLPRLSDEQGFGERVLEAVKAAEQKVGARAGNKRSSARWRNPWLLPYLAASIVTLVLTWFGMFSPVEGNMDGLAEEPGWKEQPSYTQQVMDRTVEWLDKWINERSDQP